MKWVVERDAMVDVLQDLVAITEKSAIMPITSNVKVAIHGNTISMVTTDTKLQIKATINLASDQYLEEGITTTVSAQKLLDSCKVVADKEIVFDLKDNKLTIAFKKGNFALLTQRATEFPEIAEAEQSNSKVSLPQRIWSELINSSMYAAAENHHREMICGILLEVEGSTVRMVATNGHRLAIAETENEHAIEGDFKQAVLPKKSLQEMQRLLTDSDAILTLSFQGNSHVSFQLEKNNISFTSNLIEGEYPAYDKVIPKTNDKLLKVKKHALSTAVSNAVIIQKAPPRTVELKMSQENMQVSSSNFEGEISHMELDIDFEHAESMEMSFNEEYLQSALKFLKEETVEIQIGTSNSSIFISETSANVTRKSVVMPLNT